MSKTVKKVSRCLLLVTILCCLLLSVTEAAESALRIVRRYCQLDSEGARLGAGSDGQIQKLSEWEAEPGWDSAVVIKSYRTKLQQSDATHASVLVTYDEYGKLDGDQFTARQTSEEVVFALTKVGSGWKIRSPKLPPHVRPAALVAHINHIIALEGEKTRGTWVPVLDRLKTLARRREKGKVASPSTQP
jgi:hypothetical protein